MSNQDKALAAAESGRRISVPSDAGNKNDDPPPPYSPSFEPPATSKSPPLPQKPPALTREPSPVRTNVIPGPCLQTENNSTEPHSAWENAKDVCCLALYSIWIPISNCINCCARRCSKLKPR